jgi:putative tryptophan/tyrosine transport system substrate-binding protein
MRRRDLNLGIAGSAIAWPLVARAQQPERLRRVGVLMGFAENDPEGLHWLSSFTNAFQQLGWTDGRNVQIDVRWGASNVERNKAFANELVNLQPDVILSHGTPVTAALQRETKTIPIVFVTVADPVGAGYVKSLSQPGGNITGFIFAEAEIGGKWLELLKEIAPTTKRAAIIYNPDTAPGHGSYYLPSFQSAARLLNVEPIDAPVRSDAEIDKLISSLSGEAGSGLVAGGDVFTVAHRGAIISAAAKSKVPAIYFTPVFAKDGGLLVYGPDNADIFRRAAPYVDQILHGANPARLPVQVPTKYLLSVNLKTAKTLDLNVPPQLQQLADEVIE